MPQFDAVSFMTQVFWVGVLFITFYGVVKAQFLPRFAASVKARTKMLRLLENPTECGQAEALDQMYSRCVRTIQSHFENGWTKVNSILDMYLLFCQSTTLLGAAAVPSTSFRAKELTLPLIKTKSSKKGGKKKI
jgi:hypothetical protein